MASVKMLETAERKRREKFEREHKMINGVDHKICNKHHIYFPKESPWFPATNEYYYKNNKNSIDFLHPECKKCAIVEAIQWKKDNPERYKELMIKVEAKPSRKRDNRGRATKQRLAGKQAVWQRNNPEKTKQYTLNHRNHDITDAEWNGCLKSFDYKCAYCSMTEEEHKAKVNQVLHKEHADHQGANDLSNAIPSCGSCNYKKWAFPMEEWYREQEFFSEERLELIKWWTTEGYKDYIEDKSPYRIIKKRNDHNNKFHYELWSVDDKRNMIKCLTTRTKKKEIINDLENSIIDMPIVVQT